MNLNRQMLDRIITNQDWRSLLYEYSPQDTVNICSYIEAMHLVGYLMMASSDEIISDGAAADSMRDFAVEIMLLVREKHRKEWWNDWKNEAFLGISCALVYREAEAFKYCKSAYEYLEDPPQSLILAYISAGQRADQFLSPKEIAKLTNNALQKGETYQATLHMAFITALSGDNKTAEYWKQKAAIAEKNGYHTPVITPNILKELFSHQGGKKNED